MKDHKKFAWFLLDHFHINFLMFFFLTLKVWTKEPNGDDS